jgi:hypothetical protein
VLGAQCNTTLGQCQVTSCAYVTYSHGIHGCGPIGTGYYMDCNGDWSDGCETAPGAAGSCGACGFTCPAGLTCSNSTGYTEQSRPGCEDTNNAYKTGSGTQCGGAWFCGIVNGC